MIKREPAFPFDSSNNENFTGLLVRDYIAIEAMKCFMNDEILSLKEVAHKSYELADIMIEESKL